MLNTSRIDYINKLKRMNDIASIKRIELLHPKLRDEVLAILLEVESKGVFIRITQGLRTVAEQDALYAQGRTKPGSKVTNAQGGNSFHNWGLAVDFCLLHKDGKISWSLTEDMDKDGKKDWMEVVEVFKKYNWKWGGDFKSIKDNPHFEKTFSNTLAQLKLLKKDKEGYVIL